MTITKKSKKTDYKLPNQQCCKTAEDKLSRLFNKLYTIEDFMELAKIKKSQVRSLIFYKKITFIKVGHLIRFKQEDILHFLNSNTVCSK